MAVDGYIFAYQDVRGKYKSEGTMQIHQPLVHLWKPGAVDESTDTWDAVDWLIKNVPGNNGKAGIVGISYPGLARARGCGRPASGVEGGFGAGLYGGFVPWRRLSP
jgi:hypothetical protein